MTQRQLSRIELKPVLWVDYEAVVERGRFDTECEGGIRGRCRWMSCYLTCRDGGRVDYQVLIGGEGDGSTFDGRRGRIEVEVAKKKIISFSLPG